MTVDTTAQHELLVCALMDPERWPQGGGGRRRIDTHISTVILAGEVAYKLKKPLDLGFLDFKSLESRHRACTEELRLNRRFAPGIYQAVCAVTGSIEHPEIDGTGEPIDWVVRMRRFDPDAILSSQMHKLDGELIDSLAIRVARFHAQAAVCGPQEPYGSPELVYAPMTGNLQEVARRVPRFESDVESLAAWTARQREHLDSRLRQRKSQGFIRECHGDLHLGNVALIDSRPTMFDAIEFNPGLRWIDTINDLAFMTMDLQERGRTDLAYRFLDLYLSETGDYRGLALLPFYEVYRALVRAKIAAIRCGQKDLSTADIDGIHAELLAYIRFAERLCRPRSGAVVLMRGVSGSGKSHVSRSIPEFLPAVRLRSDVERKRLLGLDPHSDATALGAYSDEITHRTYSRLGELTTEVVSAGFVAVVDATFLQRTRREHFRKIAESCRVPFAIIDCTAPPDLLRERIAARNRDPSNVSDAGLAVLDAQLESDEGLSAEEESVSLVVTPDRALDREALQAVVRPDRA